MTLGGLRALTFDFWGTLYQSASGEEARLDVLDEALRRHGYQCSRETMRAAHSYAWGVFQRAWLEERRSLTTQRWISEMLDFLEADLPADVRAALTGPLEEVFLSGHGETPVPVPGVCRVLPLLAQRYCLGLISDVGLTPGRVLTEVLRRDGLLPCFSALTFSDESGVTKPTPQVFLNTLERLGAQPSEAAHIGDLPETDLVGARAVGMRAILFLGISNRTDGRELASATFDDYDQLEGLLAALE